VWTFRWADGARRASGRGCPIVFYDTDHLDTPVFFDVPGRYDTQQGKAR
jgi:hypothetical protein